MKRLLFTIIAALIFVVSCEDEKTTLSEFVVGTWKSQELSLGTSPLGTFTAIINANNTYVLTFTLLDGSMSVTTPPTGYTVDEEKSQITVTEPDFDPTDGITPTGKQTFSVEWKEGSNVMTWIPDNTGGGDAPTLVWTRQ